jgi:outer membrane protein TolC
MNGHDHYISRFKLKLLLAGLLLSFGQNLSAQQLWTMSLNDCIELAKKQSSAALLAKTTYRASYWRYKYYRAELLPFLSANATIPDLNRSVLPVTQPDGNDIFVNRSQVGSSLNLNLSQQIGLTGGSVYLNSGAQRIDYLNTKTTSYLSTPVSIGLTQPVFGYNAYKWSKLIEPLYYKEARRQYLQDMEDLAINASSLFFDVISEKTNVSMAKLEQANSDTLYRLAQGRYGYGKIAENELLQHELNLLNAGLAYQQANISYGAAVASLKSFLGLSSRDSIDLILPSEPDSIHINAQEALIQAVNNSTNAISFDRRKQEAARDVAQARGQNGLQGSLFGEYGLNKAASTLPNTYLNPADQEQLKFGLQLPLLDWGKAKGAIEMAKAQQELVSTNLKKEQTDFEQGVMLEVAEYNLQGSQLKIAHKADEVGQRRYYIAKQRFLLGKISITDLNIAQNDRDAAQRAYIQVLRNAWQSYYRLRKTTLYDFVLKTTLDKITPEAL